MKREIEKEGAGDIEDLTQQIQGSYNYYSPEVLIKIALQRRCKSVAFTYNEPSIWGEYAHDIAKLAHENGLCDERLYDGGAPALHPAVCGRDEH